MAASPSSLSGGPGGEGGGIIAVTANIDAPSTTAIFFFLVEGGRWNREEGKLRDVGFWLRGGETFFGFSGAEYKSIRI